MNNLRQSIIDILRSGGLCIVQDDASRENEGDFIGLGATISYESLNIMVSRGKGLVCVPIGPERAQKWGLGPMTTLNQDPHGTAFTISVDAAACGTGISIADRLLTVRTLAGDSIQKSELRSPGHIFPLLSKLGGLQVRRGHTEAAIELTKLCGQSDCAVICEIMAEDGTMLRGPGLKKLADEMGIPLININDILSWAMDDSGTRLPSDYGDFDIQAFHNPPQSALLILDKSRTFSPAAHPDGPLCRIHSECLTGDIFASRRCDCGPQLQKSLQMLQAEGAGLLFYLRQEGRGIGLSEKLKAYRLQDDGLDTLEANLALGHEADLRNYEPVAQWLKDHGVGKVRLLTNNPVKVKALESLGINVTRIPLWVGINDDNRAYVACKQEKFGHWVNGIA